MILYFSGTGNSKYVADYFQNQLQDDIVNMTECIKNKKLIKCQNKRPLVIVCPVYVSAPPIVVMDFIKKSKFEGNRQAYFILTCAGGMGASPYYWRKICKEKGLEYMGCEQIVMPQNYLIYFKTKEQEENKKIIQAAYPDMERIVTAIQNELPIALEPPGNLDVLSTRMILKSYYKYFINADKFTVHDNCIHCGKCEKVCPLNNIKLVDGLPTWLDNCTHCMACINYCPKTAIEYGNHSKGKPRYTAPNYKKAI